MATRGYFLLRMLNLYDMSCGYHPSVSKHGYFSKQTLLECGQYSSVVLAMACASVGVYAGGT